MKDTLEPLALSLLDAARKAGAEAADVMALRGASVSVDVRGGALEQAERAEGTDIGLRVFVGQRQAVVSATDTRPETLAMMAERAVAMAREAPEDPWTGLADPAELATAVDAAALELADPSPEPDPAELEADARAAEAAALAVAGVSQVQSASASYGARDIWLAATNGFSAGYRRTSRSRSCVAIGGEGTGMERDHDGDSRTFQSDLRPAEEIGRIAGERAVAALGAVKPPTGSFPVLFDERIAASLIGHLAAAANGAMVARGSSWLIGREEAPILPDWIDLVEDPTRPRAAGSRPFDAEGLPCRPRKVVDRGRLTGWTLDLATARKLGLKSTGNAARAPSGTPSPANWNLELTQGTASREDLIRDMGEGLLVTSLIGATINPNTGDYSRGASGFWVKDGTISHPVNEATIAGSLPDFLPRIVPANDARPWLSRVVPSLLVEGLSVAGR